MPPKFTSVPSITISATGLRLRLPKKVPLMAAVGRSRRTKDEKVSLRPTPLAAMAGETTTRRSLRSASMTWSWTPPTLRRE